MSTAPVYDEIGRGYAVVRRPAPQTGMDGFLGAFRRRPDAYPDPGVRRGTSGFAQLAPRGPRGPRVARRGPR